MGMTLLSFQDSLNRHKLRLLGPDNGQPSIPDIHMLFAVAGTGKTRAMFEKLARNYGYYFNLDPSKNSEDRYGSEDIRTVWDDIGQIIRSQTAGARKAMTLFQILFCCRALVFSEFLKFPESTALAWLSFQLSCRGGNDHFTKLYQVYRYCWPFSTKLPGIELNLGPEDFPLWVCLDEAQFDASRQIRGSESRLTHLLEELHHDKLSGSHIAPKIMISGTSLRLRDAVEAVRATQISLPFNPTLSPRIEIRNFCEQGIERAQILVSVFLFVRDSMRNFLLWQGMKTLKCYFNSMRSIKSATSI